MDHTFYQVSYPENLSAEAVDGLLYSVQGILGRPAFNLPVVRPGLVIEHWGSHTGITHKIGVPADRTHFIDQLETHLNGVGVGEDPQDRTTIAFDSVGEYGLSTDIEPLEFADPKRVAATIFRSMQPLEDGEKVVIQWVFTPTGKRQPLRKVYQFNAGRYANLQKNEHTLIRSTKLIRNANVYVNNRLGTAAHARANVREDWRQEKLYGKWQGAMFNAVCRIGVISPYGNAEYLQGKIESALNSISGRVQFIRSGFKSGDGITNAIIAGTSPRKWPCLLNIAELGAALALPYDSLNVPGLNLGGAIHIPATPQIPIDGRKIAHATENGKDRPLAIPWDETLRHFYVLGKTGSGKSTVLENCFLQDIEYGRGGLFIDPLGESAKRLLDCIPAKYADKVIYFDPANKDRVVGLNLLETGVNDPEIIGGVLINILKSIYADSWGDRMEYYLRQAVLTLADVPDVTLLDVPNILLDPPFRHRILADYPHSSQLMEEWLQYDKLKPQEMRDRTGPILTKIMNFSIQQSIRRVVGQPHPALNMSDVLAKKKIVIANLNKGRLPDSWRLFGTTLSALAWAAALRRDITDATPEFAIYIDEFHDLIEGPAKLSEMLAQGRGQKVALTVANQFFGQLDTDSGDMLPDILANTASKMFFHLPADDADVAARQFRPYMQASDFQSLAEQRHVIVSISTGTKTRVKPVTGHTYPPAPDLKMSSTILRNNDRHYNQSGAEVDRDISKRREAFKQGPDRGRRPSQ